MEKFAFRNFPKMKQKRCFNWKHQRAIFFLVNAVWVLALPLFLASCGDFQQSKLIGKWQATELLEDGTKIPVDPADVGFEFFQNGSYQYRSTLAYSESGTFSLRGSLLYTLDTINSASTEKAVKIITLTEDSLFLKMNDEGKERIVKLAKLK